MTSMGILTSYRSVQRHVDVVQPQALQRVQRANAGARLDVGRVRLGGDEDRFPPNRYGFAIGAPYRPFTDVYPWVLTNGGHILNPAQSTSVAGSAASIEAASFVRSLVSKKLVNEPGGSYNGFVQSYAGRLGMFGGGCGRTSALVLRRRASTRPSPSYPGQSQRQMGPL